jgi:hypothetical protein
MSAEKKKILLKFEAEGKLGWMNDPGYLAVRRRFPMLRPRDHEQPKIELSVQHPFEHFLLKYEIVLQVEKQFAWDAIDQRALSRSYPRFHLK